MRAPITENILRLGKHIQCIPIIHGRSIFAQEVRRIFLEDSYRCIAVELPVSLSKAVLKAVETLPYITAVVYSEAGENYYVPVEPGEGIIEAVRLGVGERIPIEFIDMEMDTLPQENVNLPDEYAIGHIGLLRYYQSVQPYIPNVVAGSLQDQREQWMAYQLRQLDQRFNKVLFVCGMAHLEGIRKHFYAETRPSPGAKPDYSPSIYSVHPDGIYLLTGEIPYITYLYEKSRQKLDLEIFDKTDGIKELLLETRKEYTRDFPEELERLAPNSLQLLLTYLRNLCLLQHRLTPSMYDLAVAAQGTGGGGFAARVVEMAKFYPYIDFLSPYPTLHMGFKHGWTEETQEMPLKNRLPGPDIELKSIKLEKRPRPEKKQKWKKHWGEGYTDCSWPPEDEIIERFTDHVRKRAIGLLGEDQVRVEKFTSSVKDGIDMRETLRQWHTEDIYVKEIPAVRGEVGAVVFIFDRDDDKYPWRSTWQAEHNNESTLCFYATDYKEDIIGPGIARSYYGGALFIFPPIAIPDIWTDPRFMRMGSPAEIVTSAAVFYSHTPYIAYVSNHKPNVAQKRMAHQAKRHLIYLPLKNFSASTVRKLRKFHVLKGHHIRSYAQKYIR